MSTPINHVGAAFPVLENNGNGQLILSDAGMSLRDYFAAKAMQGFAANSQMGGPVKGFAKEAYQWADAMLKARSA